MTVLTNREDVYYLPVGLTLLQKDLMEILISLHAYSFLQQYEPEEVPKLFKMKDDVELALPPLSYLQLTCMLSANIRAIANHPCMLVEHYMPRQFLLMEPGERLIGASDKFQKLARLLDNLVCRDRNRFPKPLQIAIISHSVKELDLLEGFLLGNPAKLKRLSGTSLFDERHMYGDPDTEGSTPPISTGYMKDDYDYGKRNGDSKRPSKNNEDWFFLATTKHMSHAVGLFDDYDIDMIIGFDPMMDEHLESVVKMRSGNKLVPLIKLLVRDSPDHYTLCHGDARDEDELMKESLTHFIKNRESITRNGDPYWMRQFVEDLLSGEKNLTSLPEIQLSKNNTDDSLVHDLTTYGGLSKLPDVSFKLAPNVGDLDIKTYQAKLMDLIVSRLNSCEEEYHIREEQILGKRLRETLRQNQFDETKVEAGQMYKKLKSSEGSLADSIKKLSSVKADYGKSQDRFTILQERKRHLERLASTHNIAENLQVMSDKLIKLKTELVELTAESSKQTGLNDQLRLKYQAKSTEAANQSMILKGLQQTQEFLKKEISGPAMTLQTNYALEQEKTLQRHLDQLSQQSNFLHGYIKKMQKQYSLNGIAPSENSSSSNSRTRRGRSTAPIYT